MIRIYKKIFLSVLFFNAAMLHSQNIAVVGDFENTPVRVDSVAMLVKSWNPDLIVLTGDIFDATAGSTIDTMVGKYYSDYIFPYNGVFGSTATVNKFYSCIGNHVLNGNGLTQFLDYFTYPGNERYYKVEIGNVSFYIINSNPSEIDGVADTSVQGLWLKNELSMADSNWNIVVFHHPPYTSGAHPSLTYMRWPFGAWGADVVINGHNHQYERLSAEGITYFVNGTGGAALYSTYTQIPESQFIYTECWGAQLVQPFADSIVFSFYNIRDSLIDRYVIHKNPLSIENHIKVFSDILQNHIEIGFSGINPGNIYNVEVYDIQGRLIKSKQNIKPENNKLSVSISDLISGIYFIKVFDKATHNSAKFIVSR